MDGKTIDTTSLNGKLSSGDFEVSAQVVGTEVRYSTMRICAATGHQVVTSCSFISSKSSFTLRVFYQPAC